MRRLTEHGVCGTSNNGPRRKGHRLSALAIDDRPLPALDGQAHRQAEVADCHWLEAYESNFKLPSADMRCPMHGPTWTRYRNSIDPKIGVLGLLSRFGGFQVWSCGLASELQLWWSCSCRQSLLSCYPRLPDLHSRRTDTPARSGSAGLFHRLQVPSAQNVAVPGSHASL
jgi:hypothetical protein